jgi:predicted GTPase
MAFVYDPLDVKLHLTFASSVPLEPKQVLDVVIRIEVKNEKLISIIKDGGHFLYEGGDKKYFQPTKDFIKNLDSTKIRLEPIASASIETIPSKLEFILRDKNGTTIKTASWIMEMSDFAGSLYPKNRDDAVRNILLFGLAGSTKSSFINSAYSMLSQEVMLDIAQSGGHDERVTTELTSYKLANLTNEKTTQYRLWDTWGLETKNYESCEFQNIIRGQASDGWKMVEVNRKRLGDLAQIPVKQNNIQHCVIFFIPMAELDTEGSELLNKTREFMQKATSHGVSSLLVITKVDTLVPAFKDNPSIQSEVVKSKIKKAELLFSLPPQRIFPLVNYHKDTKKNIEIDRLVLSILSIAANMADNYVLTHPTTGGSIQDAKKRSIIKG